MSSRRYVPLAHEERPSQAPGMMRHGPFPGLGPAAGHRSLESLPIQDVVGNKVAVQAAEMERLGGNNEKLATTHVILRQELVATQHEIQRLNAHLRSIQTESDIQIRILLDKISKMQVDLRVGESVKKDLQEAHKEAQSLVTARQELTIRIPKAHQELQKARDEAKNIPEMRAELDSLRKEHHRLRATFEHEKGRNIEQVEQMQAMEKNMVGMARELEKMRVEVLNAEARARAPIPYTGLHMNQDPSYPPPPPMHNSDPYLPPPPPSRPYIDGYGRPLPMGMVPAGEGMIQYGVGHSLPVVEGMVPYGGGPGVPAGEGMIPYGIGPGVAAPPGARSGPVWGGAYDPSLIPQR